MSEKMRAEFEEWLIANTEFDTQRTAFAITKEEDQQYMCHRTNLAWLAWQASRAALVVELPSNCKGMAITAEELRVMMKKIGVTLK